MDGDIAGCTGVSTVGCTESDAGDSIDGGIVGYTGVTQVATLLVA